MRRLVVVLAVLLALLLAGILAGASLGPVRMDPGRVVSALAGRGDSAAMTLVWDLRLPRVMAALVAGACLGAAGALLQSATRNPLGDPQVFGVGGGAAVVQALAMAGAIRTGSVGLAALSVLASLAVALAAAFLASRRGVSPGRLALVGVSVAALSGAVATGVLAEARVFTQQSVAFLGGSLVNRTWDDVFSVLPFAVGGLLMALPAVDHLNLLALGDRVAANLGVRPARARALGMAAAGVLAGAGVAVAGMVGFIGLMVPHFTRLLVGHDSRVVLAVSVPLGAVVTLFADQAARLVFMPNEVPVGLVTALIGAPLMIAVARRVAWT